MDNFLIWGLRIWRDGWLGSNFHLWNNRLGNCHISVRQSERDGLAYNSCR
ncbi:hypothetical protein [Aquaspirillum serpens]|nr:hypothetical protein [Aquaspirillum serpens]